MIILNIIPENIAIEKLARVPIRNISLKDLSSCIFSNLAIDFVVITKLTAVNLLSITSINTKILSKIPINSPPLYFIKLSIVPSSEVIASLEKHVFILGG